MKVRQPEPDNAGDSRVRACVPLWPRRSSQDLPPRENAAPWTCKWPLCAEGEVAVGREGKGKEVE